MKAGRYVEAKYMSDFLNSEMVAKIRSMVNKGCTKYRINPDDREDILQDIYVRVLEKEKSIMLADDKVQYVNRLIDNFICTRSKKQSKRARTHTNTEVDVPDTRGMDITDILTLDDLHKYLTPTEVKIYEGYRQGYTLQDISDQLNMTKVNVKVSMHRIIKRLRTVTGDPGKVSNK
jgi:RNA polymerase sigma factor (sigma-70 family)